MLEEVNCPKCNNSHYIIVEVVGKCNDCPFCGHPYIASEDPKDKREHQNGVITRNTNHSSSSSNDGLFAIIAILIVVTCLLIIPGCLMDSIMDVGKAFLTGISCLFLVGLLFTIRFFENKIAHIACVCGIICALWFFGFFLDFVFSKMKSSSKGIGDTLTTEQKIELYTEREASGAVGNRNWEIRKVGEQRIIVIEEDGKKIYLPVKE